MLIFKKKAVQCINNKSVSVKKIILKKYINDNKIERIFENQNETLDSAKEFVFKNADCFSNKESVILSSYLLKDFILNRNKLIKSYSTSFLVKKLLFACITSSKTSFFIKRLVISILDFYNIQVIRLKNLLLSNDGCLIAYNLSQTLLSNVEVTFLKQVLFAVNNKRSKNQVVLKRDFLLFLIKNESVIINDKDKIIFKKLILSYFSENKKLSITKKNLVFYKKAIKLIYKKDKINKIQELRNKLVGLVMKEGYKTKALRIVENSLRQASVELNLSQNSILLKVFDKLKTSVESKKIRVRRSFHFVPFPVNLKRKVYLIAKWILVGVTERKIKKSFDFKLSSELVKIIKTKIATSYKNKRYNIYKSLQNKSNIHYRW